MQWSDIPRNPNSNTLRWFAGICLLWFASLAAWQGFLRGQTAAAGLLMTVAFGVGLVGFLWPQSVRPVYVGSMVAVFPLGWTFSVVLLAILFYGVLTPIGILFRLRSRDVLCRRPDPARSSYWGIKPAPADPRSYFRQF
ncbi:MAG TPA: hypothetical protein VKU02_23480 [Gemmataceae bacterium]|nr:hypothetical protein [Gemmataceae bacterium]